MNRILSFFRGLFGSGGSRAHGHGADPGYHGGEDRRYDETEEDYDEEDGSYDDVRGNAPEEESPANAGAEDPNEPKRTSVIEDLRLFNRQTRLL